MSKYRREEISSEDSDSEEERRKKDIKERDSFASRLRAKDESKIRKIAMPAGSGAGELQTMGLYSFGKFAAILSVLTLSTLFMELQ